MAESRQQPTSSVDPDTRHAPRLRATGREVAASVSDVRSVNGSARRRLLLWSSLFNGEDFEDW